MAGTTGHPGEPGLSFLHIWSILTDMYLCRPCSSHGIDHGTARAGNGTSRGPPQDCAGQLSRGLPAPDDAAAVAGAHAVRGARPLAPLHGERARLAILPKCAHGAGIDLAIA
eukprot:COSAG01_NODE_319_length_18909_cov_32.636151_7_plen_112_part_00